jgi:hypothetical protein
MKDIYPGFVKRNISQANFISKDWTAANLPSPRNRIAGYSSAKNRNAIVETTASRAIFLADGFIGMLLPVYNRHPDKFQPTLPSISISRIRFDHLALYFDHLTFAFNSSKALNAMGQIRMLSRTP